jgi:hypothetical protein
MIVKRMAAICALSIAALAMCAAPVPAAGKKSLRANRVVVEYKPAETAEHREIESSLREHQVLERMARILGPVKLPRQLTLRTMSCGGHANARYEDDAIRICYEYVEWLRNLVQVRELPTGTTRGNLLIGMMADAFFHEFGHAAFDMLEIPVFGREEDAADQFSAYVMLQFSRHDARQLITGAAFYFAQDATWGSSVAPSPDDYADDHGLPQQRFVNYICLAYGFNPELFASAVEQGKLTEARAQSCAGEYAQVERAFRKLILPYVDLRALARVRAQKWFELGLDE